MAQAGQLKTLQIIWGALISTVGVYFVVLLVVERPSELSEPLLLPALGFVAMSVAAMSVVVPGVIWRNALRAARFESVEAPDPDAPAGFKKSVRVVANPGAVRARLLALYTTRTILGCALCEAVALFGFVLGFSGLSLALCAPFFVVSALLMLAHFPTEERMLSSAEAALDLRVRG